MTHLTRNLDGDSLRERPFICDIISVNTETTNKTGGLPVRGFLAYDGDCAFCTRGVMRLRAILMRRGVGIVPLATPWVRQRLGLSEGQMTDRMWLLRPDGTQLGGADAAIELARLVPWTRPLAWLAKLPGVHGLLHVSYNWIARHRYCLGGQCKLPATQARPSRTRSLWSHSIDWLPVVALVTAAVTALQRQPAWLFMWLLALAVFAGCKWLMLRKALRENVPTTAGRIAAFLLLWPGLDARAVLNVRRPPPTAPTYGEVSAALLKTAFGALMLFVIAPLTVPTAALLAGWVAMVGLIFLLHFGAFHLIALAWRAYGVDAPLMMINPLAARSLAEFWGKRWNRDFRVLAHEIIFQPVVRRIGAMAAAGLVFLVSGLVHDLVISLPAGGGWGLPTLYFAIQFAGIVFEGSAVGQRLGLGRRWRGWCFTLLVTAGPIMLLFHAPFVHRIILPLVNALSAY